MGSTLDVPMLKLVPPLTPGFVPLAKMKVGYDAAVTKAGGSKLVLGFQRGDEVCRFETQVFPCGHVLSGWNWVLFRDLVRSGLAFYGADTVWIGAQDQDVGRELKRLGQFLYPNNDPEARVAFSAGFFQLVYGRPLEFRCVLPSEVPTASERWYPITGEVGGRVLSMDYGKSNVRAAAFNDGEQIGDPVNVNWDPALQSYPAYLLKRSLEAAKGAAENLAAGARFERMRVSTAGIVADNRILIGTILRDVPKPQFDEASRLFQRTAEAMGITDIVVINDGTVAAASLDFNNCLGAALGSDLATGYFGEGAITSQLAEGAFVPIECADLSDPASLFLYEWARTWGLGGETFSQKGAAGHLAKLADLDLSAGEDLPSKLAILQELYAGGNEKARAVCQTIARRLASAVAWWQVFYPAMEHVVLMGRVMEGTFGQDLHLEAQTALRTDYPEIAEKVTLHLGEDPEYKQLRTMAGIQAAA